MKTLSFIITMVWLPFFSIGQVYDLNVKSSKLGWTGYAEVGGFTQEGTIQSKSGQLSFEENQLKSAQVIIDMTSISNKDKSLEKHLKNEDFFFVKKHPEAKLVMSSFEDGMVKGKITIRGITKDITCPVKLEKSESKIVASGKLVVDRTKFDIKYNSSSYFQDLGSYAIKNDFLLTFELTFDR